MVNTDIYDWILSPEIRGYLRENYPLSCIEKAEVICSAYRSIEDQYAALCTLLDEAEKEADRDVLTQLLQLYRWAFRELRQIRPGQIFICEAQYTSEDDIGDLSTRCNVEGIFRTYEEVFGFLGDMEKDCDFSPGYSFYVEKWALVDNNMEEILGLDFYFMDGAFQVTRFWPSEGKHHEIYHKLNVGFDAEHLHNWYLENVFPLPFKSGDLVRLDPPVLDAPAYGVLYRFDAAHSSRFMWLFYLRNGILDYCSMCYHSIGGWSSWRVIDWTHTASFSELPSGQEILQEISQAFYRLTDYGIAEMEQLFGDLTDHLPTPVYRRTPITLKELLNCDGS